MIPAAAVQWLKEHGKGDLQECTWDELEELLAAIGGTSSLVEYQHETNQ